MNDVIAILSTTHLQSDSDYQHLLILKKVNFIFLWCFGPNFDEKAINDG